MTPAKITTWSPFRKEITFLRYLQRSQAQCKATNLNIRSTHAQRIFVSSYIHIVPNTSWSRNSQLGTPSLQITLSFQLLRTGRTAGQHVMQQQRTTHHTQNRVFCWWGILFKASSRRLLEWVSRVVVVPIVVAEWDKKQSLCVLYSLPTPSIQSRISTEWTALFQASPPNNQRQQFSGHPFLCIIPILLLILIYCYGWVRPLRSSSSSCCCRTNPTTTVCDCKKTLDPLPHHRSFLTHSVVEVLIRSVCVYSVHCSSTNWSTAFCIHCSSMDLQ